MWRNIFEHVLRRGKIVSPRGQKCLEIENYQFTGDPLNRFCNFKSRNLNLRYLVGELAWYLSGNRDNQMIEKYSKFWKEIKNEETPFYNSNYGYYIFQQGQLIHCLDTLIKDPESRQAVIIIANLDNNLSQTKDKICTYSISFRIRENKLNMTVNMRSNDLILGLTVDYFQFSVIQEMLFVMLQDLYKDLELGTYTHKADSLHVYGRHFDMLEKIVHGDEFNYVSCPRIESQHEVRVLKDTLPLIASSDSNLPPPKALDEFNFLTWCIHQLNKPENAKLSAM